MWEVLSQLSGDELLALLVVAMIILLGLIVSCVAAWQTHREREMAVTIIQDMLDQGLSSDQIERVLKAAGFGSRSTRAHSVRERLLAARSAARENIRGAPT